VIPPEKSGGFVANMEQVLDVYKIPYDAEFPVICMDESPKRLIEEGKPSVAMKPGQDAREDYEYLESWLKFILFIKKQPFKWSIELTPGFNPLAYVEYRTVYIDFNHNGIFEPSEIVGEKHTYIRVNKSFPIPVTALNCATRMRIQMQGGAQETNPCSTYTYGEVEDYTIVITSTIAGTVVTNPDFKNIILRKGQNSEFLD